MLACNYYYTTALINKQIKLLHLLTLGLHVKVSQAKYSFSRQLFYPKATINNYLKRAYCLKLFYWRLCLLKQFGSIDVGKTNLV